MNEFDDEEDFKFQYENGHWEWNDKVESLEFIPNPNMFDEESWISPPGAEMIGVADFKDDMDVTEQDIKDFVLYTAPSSFINPSVINLLHLSGTERFLRALILYNQYYLQISDEMGRRMLELEEKIRTPHSVVIEKIYKENLEDLRLLIAKEYSNILTGSGEFKKFHHMGPSKKMPSLSKRGNILFETLIRVGIQIVWLALGRKYFNQIELEMHRLFKTDRFNMIEHKIKSNYVAKMSPEERYVLFGGCIQNERLMKTHSPLKNELDCQNVDWRLLGLGVLKFPNLSRRLQYMQDALTAPERLLEKKCVTVGILGFLRSRFDTTLKEIMYPAGSSTMAMGRPSMTRNRSMQASRISRVSRAVPRSSVSSRKSIGSAAAVIPEKFIPDIELPPRDPDSERISHQFPDKTLPQNPCDLIQKQKWIARAIRLARKRAKRRQCI